MVLQNLSFSEKLNALRSEMRQEALGGFLVPRIDRYMGEFIGPDAERLAWLTGFTGSAGVAIVLQDKAAVLTDGRYTIQLAQQVDKALYSAGDIVETPTAQWIVKNTKPGSVIGYDPWLHTPRQIETWEKAGHEKQIKFKAVDNLVDRVWKDKPAFPAQKAEIFPEGVAGIFAAEKIKIVSKTLSEKNVFASIINMPDSLMWLLNVRGRDMAETPVVLSMGIVYADARPVTWFVDGDKISPALGQHIKGTAQIVSPALIEKYVEALAREAKAAGKAVAVDFARAPVWFKNKLEAAGVRVIDLKDPCIMPKAIKTRSEQESIRSVHVKDGVAIVKFFYWLEKNAIGQDEISVGNKLEDFRRADKTYQGPSFPSIVGFGPNGAIVHYRAQPESKRKIEGAGLLLVDSGGQYHYGTTDITRTVAIGAPTDEMRTNFTLVLKGHIAVASAKFSKTTTGAQIDVLARRALKDAGLDYAHGTGHGVGCYLAVHEEAASLSARGQEPPQAGMLISNEPGYYKEGAYGIRTENLVLVQDADEGNLCFETVTLAPIDSRLIKKEMLTADEIQWLNFYHAQVFKTLKPLLPADIAGWLGQQTAAL